MGIKPSLTPQPSEVLIIPDSISLLGLDVHAAQTHAAVLDLATVELRRARVRLRVAPGDVAVSGEASGTGAVVV